MLRNQKKEHQRPKARAKASYNSVLVEGNIDDWFCHLLNHLLCFGCLIVEICLDKYVRKISTASGHHLKPIEGGTIRNKGYNGHHNIEDMIALIHIALDF